MTARFILGIRKFAYEVALIGGVSAILIVGFQMGHRYGHPAPPNMQMSGPLMTVGTQLHIPSMVFNKRQLTLLLVSSPFCHFCLASKAFHQRLFAEADQQGVPVFLAVPDRSSKAYAGDFHLPSTRLKDWQDLSFSVEGTPTLLAINSAGVVTQVWLGQLRPQEETLVFDLVRSSTTTAHSLPMASKYDSGNPLLAARDLDVSFEKAASLRRNHKCDVIDIRERNKTSQISKGILNIPFEEIPLRAPFEISKGILHLVDCRNIRPELCDLGVQALKQAGFRAGTIGKGDYHASFCRATKMARNSRP